MNLKNVMESLANIFQKKEEINRFPESIIYLDSKELSKIYGQFTGARGRPTVQIEGTETELKANIFVAAGATSSVLNTFEISDEFLLEALLPKMKEFYHVLDFNKALKDDIKKFKEKRIWTEGRLTQDENGFLTSRLSGLGVFERIYLQNGKSKNIVLFQEEYFSSVYKNIIGLKVLNIECDILGILFEFLDIGSQAYYIISPIVILGKQKG